MRGGKRKQKGRRNIVTKKLLWAGTILAFCTSLAAAHFQILAPDSEFAGADKREVQLEMIFTHPMEDGPVMEMGKPVEFGVVHKGRKKNLIKELKVRKIEGKTAYTADYTVKRPGDHVFYIEPAPYWEPAEQKMIVHYTKTVVNAYGQEEGWDRMVGFPVEIEPLVRPYGLWAGNTFRGIVRRNGKPVPFAEIEVEYWNREGNVDIPADAFVTQVIKAGPDGEFSYTMPIEGWWSFAALMEGNRPVKNPEGNEVDVELGALIWVHCVPMK
jgi:cobalt/nickel transport protein